MYLLILKISSKLSLGLHVNSLWLSRILGHDPTGCCSSTRSQPFVPLFPLRFQFGVSCIAASGVRQCLLEVETRPFE